MDFYTKGLLLIPGYPVTDATDSAYETEIARMQYYAGLSEEDRNNLTADEKKELTFLENRGRYYVSEDFRQRQPESYQNLKGSVEQAVKVVDSLAEGCTAEQAYLKGMLRGMEGTGKIANMLLSSLMSTYLSKSEFETPLDADIPENEKMYRENVVREATAALMAIELIDSYMKAMLATVTHTLDNLIDPVNIGSSE